VANATTVNTDNIEMERFTAADSKSGTPRHYRPVQKDNIAAPSRNPSPSIVYGKNKASKPAPAPYQAPYLKSKPKFKPSHEETSNDDSVNTYAHGYKPTPQETAALQKYMHRYSTQVYHSPKHVQQQQGENQKQKFQPIPAPQNKYKFIPVLSSEIKVEKTKEPVEIASEKYPSFAKKTPKSPPKKAYSYDSAQQGSDYKYASTDSQIAEHLMAEPEKSSWSGYEPYQYGIITADKGSDLSKITGYKIPGATSISLGHTVETDEEEKHEEEHYDDVSICKRELVVRAATTLV